MRTDCKDPGYLDEVMSKAKEEEAENWQTRKAGPQCAQNNCYVSERRSFEMLDTCSNQSQTSYLHLESADQRHTTRQSKFQTAKQKAV
jgi:hypothetical protein